MSFSAKLTCRSAARSAASRPSSYCGGQLRSLPREASKMAGTLNIKAMRVCKPPFRTAASTVASSLGTGMSGFPLSALLEVRAPVALANDSPRLVPDASCVRRDILRSTIQLFHSHLERCPVQHDRCPSQSGDQIWARSVAGICRLEYSPILRRNATHHHAACTGRITPSDGARRVLAGQCARFCSSSFAGSERLHPCCCAECELIRCHRKPSRGVHCHLRRPRRPGAAHKEVMAI